MQFYPNMRFPSPEISYKISSCPLQKQNDMEFAFGILENLTSLEFYSVGNNEEISITCEERERVENGLFIAGEGGPSNITIAGQFNVIMHGEILLIKESECPKPNIALHELFHALGFDHSSNPENIMYNVTDCNQITGTDMIQLINTLYAIPSYPDLAFENVSAFISGRFLSINMTVINEGLNDAANAKIEIYTDDNPVKEIDLVPLEIGRGRIITIGNIFVRKMSVNELELMITSDFSEINKDNNKIKLKIKE